MNIGSMKDRKYDEKKQKSEIWHQPKVWSVTVNLMEELMISTKTKKVNLRTLPYHNFVKHTKNSHNPLPKYNNTTLFYLYFSLNNKS